MRQFAPFLGEYKRSNTERLIKLRPDNNRALEREIPVKTVELQDLVAGIPVTSLKQLEAKDMLSYLSINEDKPILITQRCY